MDSELFNKHLKLFALDNGNAADLLSSETFFFDRADYAYVDDGEGWFTALNLANIDVLYVYGVGSGHAYQTAASWLHENKKRWLIFLEDDLSVVDRLLGTEQASPLLNDLQVRLFYFCDIDTDWPFFHRLIWDHLFVGATVVALPAYAHTKKQELTLLTRKIAFETASKRQRAWEDLEHGGVLFKNYYRNLFHLPQAYLGSHVFKQFLNIPAIICGAGPSLEKQIPLLQTLQDNALIFGVGSSMNILNAHGFLPHFGAAIDPYSEQYNRLAMNQAYEVPFFYHNRVMHEGVELIHGPHLFITGSGAYDVGDWFESKLHIPSEPRIEEGFGVINFIISVAREMGCNPIILVGMDLSDKEGKHYSPGIDNHPLYTGPKSTDGHDPLGERLEAKDVFGEPVHTYWSWIAEGTWITSFAKSYPDVQVINATEGGIAIAGVPNVPLKEVVDTRLLCSFDLRGLVHEAVQKARLTLPISRADVAEALIEFRSSLERCARGNLASADLQKEPAYRYLLKDFREGYLNCIHGELTEADRLQKQNEGGKVARLEEKINKQVSAFLHDVADTHCQIIDHTLQEAANIPEEDLSQPGGLALSNRDALCSRPIPDEILQVAQNGMRWLYYPDGALYAKLYEHDHRFEGQQEYYYPGGAIKSVLPYDQGLLHGTVRLYYPSGQLKMEIDFDHGKRHGFEKRWYRNGQLFVDVTYE
jgi:hypothetical protein